MIDEEAAVDRRARMNIDARQRMGNLGDDPRATSTAPSSNSRAAPADNGRWPSRPDSRPALSSTLRAAGSPSKASADVGFQQFTNRRQPVGETSHDRDRSASAAFRWPLRRRRRIAVRVTLADQLAQRLVERVTDKKVDAFAVGCMRRQAIGKQRGNNAFHDRRQRQRRRQFGRSVQTTKRRERGLPQIAQLFDDRVNVPVQDSRGATPQLPLSALPSIRVG